MIAGNMVFVEAEGAAPSYGRPRRGCRSPGCQQLPKGPQHPGHPCPWSAANATHPPGSHPESPRWAKLFLLGAPAACTQGASLPFASITEKGRSASFLFSGPRARLTASGLDCMGQMSAAARGDPCRRGRPCPLDLLRSGSSGHADGGVEEAGSTVWGRAGRWTSRPMELCWATVLGCDALPGSLVRSQERGQRLQKFTRPSCSARSVLEPQGPPQRRSVDALFGGPGRQLGSEHRHPVLVASVLSCGRRLKGRAMPEPGL